MTDRSRRIIVADRVLTVDRWATVYAPGAVAITDGRIEAVGPPQAMPAGDVEILSEHVLLPGLVNTHTHTPMWLYRGLTEDVPRGEWLSRRMRPLERQVSLDDLRAGTSAGCLELLLNGVTTIADRYGEMDSLAAQVEASGLRALVAHSLYDSDAVAGLRRTEVLIDRYGTDPTASRVTAAIGPHATDSCGPDLLREVRRLADRTAARVVIHLAQSAEEVVMVAARDNTSCADYLDDLGLLAPEVIVAHCTYVSDSEADLIGRRATAVAHCPSSNAKLEGRVAPVARMKAGGAMVGLGTDAACCNNSMDLFREMHVAGLLHKVAAGDPAVMSGSELLRMATIDGARALGMDALIGSLEVGKRADLIAVRTSAAHLQPWHVDAANVVHASRGSDVTAVWIEGQRLVRDAQPTRLDVSQIVRAASDAARRLMPLAV